VKIGAHLEMDVVNAECLTAENWWCKLQHRIKERCSTAEKIALAVAIVATAIIVTDIIWIAEIEIIK